MSAPKFLAFQAILLLNKSFERETIILKANSTYFSGCYSTFKGKWTEIVQ